jgi:hypothetical protein
MGIFRSYRTPRERRYFTETSADQGFHCGLAERLRDDLFKLLSPIEIDGASKPPEKLRQASSSLAMIQERRAFAVRPDAIGEGASPAKFFGKRRKFDHVHAAADAECRTDEGPHPVNA